VFFFFSKGKNLGATCVHAVAFGLSDCRQVFGKGPVNGISRFSYIFIRKKTDDEREERKMRKKNVNFSLCMFGMEKM
jgi:ribonuclease PH